MSVVGMQLSSQQNHHLFAHNIASFISDARV